MDLVEDDRMIPWPHHPNALCRQFRQLMVSCLSRNWNFPLRALV
jgi:hypothetical protein